MTDRPTNAPRGLEDVVRRALVDFWCADLDPDEAEFVRSAEETQQAVDAHLPVLAAAIREWLTSEAVVEAAARAHHENGPQRTPGGGSWDRAAEHIKTSGRTRARAALDAAAGVV